MGGWIEDNHQSVKSLGIRMQKMIILMVDFKSGGAKGGYKDLRLELIKFIVSDDV